MNLFQTHIVCIDKNLLKLICKYKCGESIAAWFNSFLVFLESSVVGVLIKMPDVVPKTSQTKKNTNRD